MLLKHLAKDAAEWLNSFFLRFYHEVWMRIALNSVSEWVFSRLMDRNHITRMISPSAAPAVSAFYMIGQSVISAPLTAPSTPQFPGFFFRSENERPYRFRFSHAAFINQCALRTVTPNVTECVLLSHGRHQFSLFRDCCQRTIVDPPTPSSSLPFATPLSISMILWWISYAVASWIRRCLSKHGACGESGDVWWVTFGMRRVTSDVSRAAWFVSRSLFLRFFDLRSHRLHVRRC